MVCLFVNWNIRFLVVKSNIFFFLGYISFYFRFVFNLIYIYIG